MKDAKIEIISYSKADIIKTSGLVAEEEEYDCIQGAWGM